MRDDANHVKFVAGNNPSRLVLGVVEEVDGPPSSSRRLGAGPIRE